MSLGTPEHNWEKYYRLKKGDAYVEIGAFRGRYALIASAKGCSKIVLVEPSPVNQKYIEQNITSGLLKNTTLVKVAISTVIGMSDFVISDNPSAHRLGTYYKDTTKVKTDTIDNVLLPIGDIDLLAADCEGAESTMFDCAVEVLKQKRIKNIAIAVYHAIDNAAIVSKHLADNGYIHIKHEDGIVYGRLR